MYLSQRVLDTACAADVVTEAEQGQILRVVPEREGHRLDLQWAVPPEQQVYRAAPCAYLGHLIGCVQAAADKELLVCSGAVLHIYQWPNPLSTHCFTCSCSLTFIATLMRCSDDDGSGVLLIEKVCKHLG